MEHKNETVRVYYACLGCYNEGRHTGEWVDADQLEYRYEMAEGMNPVINKACTILHHDEWAIHDYDGLPNLGEHPDIPHLIATMRGIEEYGRPFFHWVNLDPHNKSHHDDLGEAFQDAYRGGYRSKEDFAAQHAEDMGYISPNNQNPLLMYVDYDWFWKSSLRYSYDAVFDKHTGVTHIFRGDA